jgi:hypothetical protein
MAPPSSGNRAIVTDGTANLDVARPPVDAGAAERAADSDVAETAGRAGLVARGLMYCLIAALCAGVAVGHDEEGAVDQRGALSSLAARPWGRMVLVPLVLGFVGYAAWRMLRAITGRREGGSSREGRKGLALRAVDAGKAIAYAGLAVSAISVLFDDDSDGGDTRGWTATLLADDIGRVAVGAVAAALMVGGASLAWRGWHERFAARLELTGVAARHRRVVLAVGRVGYVSRGVVIAVVGSFVAVAALRRSSGEPIGVDETIRRIVSAGLLGQALVGATAVGFAAFGLVSFIEASYRKVLEE